MSVELLNGILPLASSLVAFVFAVIVLKRWSTRKRLYLLFWGIGLFYYAIGGAMEAWYGLVGWSPWVFRLWYLFGAILVAAWLGQGTVFLLVRRTWAWTLFGILAVGSIYAVYKVFTAQLDPSLMIGHELSGHAITSGGVRILTPFFNLYGLLMLVGGAAWSAWLFWRKRVLLNRVTGNILIAVGALAPGFGGAFQRAGLPLALYAGEFIGAVLMFIGFLYATHPAPAQKPRPVQVPNATSI